jgi:hypothetical protein
MISMASSKQHDEDQWMKLPGCADVRIDEVKVEVRKACLAEYVTHVQRK